MDEIGVKLDTRNNITITERGSKAVRIRKSKNDE